MNTVSSCDVCVLRNREADRSHLSFFAQFCFIFLGFYLLFNRKAGLVYVQFQVKQITWNVQQNNSSIHVFK